MPQYAGFRCLPYAMTGLTTAVLFVFSMSTGLAGDDAVIPTDIKQVPPSIVQLEAGGYWSSGGKEGFYRAIVAAAGTEHVNHSLYVQWIQVDPDSGVSKVAASAPVKEINEGHAQSYVLKVRRKASKLGTLRLSIVVSRERSNDNLNFDLSANGAVGQYQIKVAK